ncbi:MAG: MmcQ/YjbR family DNA-binding protein [Vicinamibacterales bacterium]
MRDGDRALERLRKACLSFPETTEVGSWGHPNFRAGKRTFAAFEWIEGRPSIAFRLSPSEVDRRIGRKPFFATPYGRSHWVSIWADSAVSWTTVERLLEQSYRTIALKRMIAVLDGIAKRA